MALSGEIFGGVNQQQQSGGSKPMQLAVLGALAYRAIKDKGGLSNVRGGSAPQQNATAPQPGGGGSMSGFSGMLPGGLTGLLSEVSGGAPGSTVSNGVQHLLDRFRQNGMGEKIESWISKNPNQSISPAEMEQGLGSDMVNWLMQETRMGKSELLSGLARYLPEAVDKLTPQGQVPTSEEAQQHANQQGAH